MTNETKKILIIEDDSGIWTLLEAAFIGSGFQIFRASSGEEGIHVAASKSPDLITLDLGLPGIDGFEVIKRLRAWTKVPILVLSARGQEQEKVKALDLGANDYITKPFSVGEFLARVRVALRTQSKTSPESELKTFVTPDFSINFIGRTVDVHGKRILMTPKEFHLISLLIENADRVITHRQLLREVWGPTYESQVQYLRVFMKNIREKLEPDAGRPKYFITEVGVGYVFRGVVE